MNKRLMGKATNKNKLRKVNSLPTGCMLKTVSVEKIVRGNCRYDGQLQF